MDEEEQKEFKERFTLTCRKCGSDNVVIDIKLGIDYGGETGYQAGSLSIGCNACQDNDFFVYGL